MDFPFISRNTANGEFDKEMHTRLCAMFSFDSKDHNFIYAVSLFSLKFRCPLSNLKSGKGRFASFKIMIARSVAFVAQAF